MARNSGSSNGKPIVMRTIAPIIYYDHLHPTKLVHGHSEIDKLQQFLTKEFFKELRKDGLGESAVDCAIRLLTHYKGRKRV